MASKCKVVFRKNAVNASALLMYRGRVLNTLHFGRGQRVTVAAAREAKNKLMAGCEILARSYRRKPSSRYSLYQNKTTSLYGGARRRKKR